MLATLDVVIAFAVIMTVASLLITVLVQMFSAALSLRGKNLSNALALTFQTIEPNLREHAHELAAQILSDPIFSDSLFAPKNRSQPSLAMQTLINAERKLMAARGPPPLPWQPLKRLSPKRRLRSQVASSPLDTASDHEALELSQLERSHDFGDGDQTGRDLPPSTRVQRHDPHRSHAARAAGHVDRSIRRAYPRLGSS